MFVTIFYGEGPKGSFAVQIIRDLPNVEIIEHDDWQFGWSVTVEHKTIEDVVIIRDKLRNANTNYGSHTVPKNAIEWHKKRLVNKIEAVERKISYSQEQIAIYQEYLDEDTAKRDKLVEQLANIERDNA